MLVDLYDVKASYLSTAPCRVAGCGVLQGVCVSGAYTRPLPPDAVLYQIYYICAVRFSWAALQTGYLCLAVLFRMNAGGARGPGPTRGASGKFCDCYFVTRLGQP